MPVLPQLNFAPVTVITTFALDPHDASPRWTPKIFDSRHPEDGDELALDVAMRAGAAPVLQAVYQGYIDGGIFSPSPISHVIPLFRDLVRENENERRKLRDLYAHALHQWMGEVGSYINKLFEVGLRGLDDKWRDWDKFRAEEFVDNHLDKSFSKLALLSVGTGSKNQRMVMSKQEIYNWGYWHWAIPSPLNNFLGISALMLNANADRATTDVHELSEASHDLNFHRLSPSVLTYDQFAYSFAALNPFLRELAILQLEKDANKPEVDLEVDKSVNWLMQHWAGNPSLLLRLQKEGESVEWQ